jgi:hypothetical protein
MTFAYADPAGHCTSGPAPGAVDLANTLLHRWGPFGATSLGIFACRKIAGTDTWSVHAEGRAFDLGIPPDSRPELGDAVLRELLRAPDELLQRVIWWGQVYDRQTPGGRPLGGGNPHEDHLHIEIPWEHADGLTSAEIAALLGETERERDPTVHLIVAYHGAQWIVAGDLTSRVGLADGADVRTLDAVGGGAFYIPAVLSTALMDKIPEVRSA